ncbi:hypothetical protein BpsM61_00055 [Bacillus phage vB_BpsM-61]|nr:hypothetical protein BpsM61_00055 [Bacillus phage vB_BpsM-61]
MASDIFSFTWEGIEEFADLLDEMVDGMDEIIEDEYTKFGLLVEEGARALAPRDLGDLTDSIASEGASVSKSEITVEITVGSEYGIYQHELEPRPGSHPKYDRGAKLPDYYQNGRGLKTRGKPGWRGEQAGRKYLERAVQLTEKDFDEMNERALERIMEGK